MKRRDFKKLRDREILVRYREVESSCVLNNGRRKRLCQNCIEYLESIHEKIRIHTNGEVHWMPLPQCTTRKQRQH